MPLATALQEARALARGNLRQGASEILAWRRTGILPEGVIQQAGELLLPFDPSEHLRRAEDLFVEEALQHAAQCPLNASQL